MQVHECIVKLLDPTAVREAGKTINELGGMQAMQANFYIYCIIGASLRTQLVTSIAATSGLCCSCCE